MTPLALSESWWDALGWTGWTFAVAVLVCLVLFAIAWGFMRLFVRPWKKWRGAREALERRWWDEVPRTFRCDDEERAGGG